MIVAQDHCTRTGALLVPKGYRVSERLVARLANFNQADIVRSAQKIRSLSLLEELDALCDVLETAEQNNARVRGVPLGKLCTGVCASGK